MHVCIQLNDIWFEYRPFVYWEQTTYIVIECQSKVHTRKFRDQFRRKWFEEFVIAELAMADLYHLLLGF